ncbi:hypothetical protein ABFS83_04G059000 [Erythranthe nasuta]
MGPSCRRKTLFKKKHLIKEPENIPAKSVIVLASPAKSPAKPPPEVAKVDASGNSNSNSNNVCSTPKSKRFRIPEIKTCPPAPKKIRIVTGGSGGGGYSLMRRRSSSSGVTAVPYFAPPDIELFFYFALRGIPI